MNCSFLNAFRSDLLALFHYLLYIASGGGTAGELTCALSDTMRTLEGGQAGACAVATAKLLHALHEAAPRFAERGAGGGFAQQDASECWSEIVRALQNRLPVAAPAPGDRYKLHSYVFYLCTVLCLYVVMYISHNFCYYYLTTLHSYIILFHRTCKQTNDMVFANKSF